MTPSSGDLAATATESTSGNSGKAKQSPKMSTNGNSIHGQSSDNMKDQFLEARDLSKQQNILASSTQLTTSNAQLEDNAQSQQQQQQPQAEEIKPSSKDVRRTTRSRLTRSVNSINGLSDMQSDKQRVSSTIHHLTSLALLDSSGRCIAHVCVHQC